MTRGMRRLKLSEAADMWLMAGSFMAKASTALVVLACIAFIAGMLREDTGVLVVSLVLAGVTALVILGAIFSYVVFLRYEKLWDATFDSD